jgi:hypothetical protein
MHDALSVPRRLRLALPGLLMLSACNAPFFQGTATTQPYQRDLAPTMDRMVATYEDLADKRFDIIADFESPEQATLFHVEPAGTAASVGISTERARTETGVGALKLSLADSRQQIVAADSPEGRWTLPRDWSRQQLLLMSVYAPRRLGGFSVSLRSGTQYPLTYTHPRIFLNPGWNLVRIDLGDLIDQVNLADIREMRFWCDPLDTPIDLYLDDLILVDNTREVFGSSNGPEGQLYVRAEGRRLAVGAAGRFELVFSRGRLRQWYDLGHDPGRLHNLTGTGALGPTPVVLPGGPKPSVVIDDITQWAPLGVTAETFQTLVEATPLRVMIQGVSRFGSADSQPDNSSPYHRWIYSVYADGRVYIECSGTAGTDSFRPAGVGMAFCVDGAFGFRRMISESRRSGDAEAAAAYTLFPRTNRGESDLLVAPYDPQSVRSLESPHDTRSCVLYPLGEPGELFTFATLLRVWPNDMDAVGQVAPMAYDYQHPLPIHMEAGQLVRTDAGDLDHDGFSEARGYYVIQLDGSIARITIDGRKNLRFAPVFKLIDVAGRDVWVYVDGRQIRELHRDADENVMFQVPGIISHDALLEITSRPRNAAPSQ